MRVCVGWILIATIIAYNSSSPLRTVVDLLTLRGLSTCEMQCVCHVSTENGHS